MGRPRNAAVALAVFASALATGLPQVANAQGSVFTAADVDESQFVMVSAPIGKGESSQLNIYEQRTSARPCFAVSGASPAVVDPLLASFDFTGMATGIRCGLVAMTLERVTACRWSKPAPMLSSWLFRRVIHPAPRWWWRVQEARETASSS
jgi:hypothetical protein